MPSQSIVAESVVILEGVDEMESVVFRKILDAQIVDAEYVVR